MKPCPWCGCEPAIDSGTFPPDTFQVFWVGCVSDKCVMDCPSTEVYPSQIEAIEAWNSYGPLTAALAPESAR